MLLSGTGINEVDAEIRGLKLVFTISVRSMSLAKGFKLWVDSGGVARLTKPKYASLAEAESFIVKNWEWLASAIEKSGRIRVSLLERLQNVPEIFTENRALKVSLLHSQAGSFFVENAARGEIVFAYINESSLEKCFREYAREKITKLVERASAKSGISFSKIRIGSQRSRWASRASTGTLSFNWRIIFLPCDIQNYIVCHELAHVRFMDHSVSFWIFLGRICERARILDRKLMKVGGEIFDIGR